MKNYEYGMDKQILKFSNPMTAIPVTISAEDVEVDERGKKIVPAGTLLGGKGGSLLDNDSTLAIPMNGAETEGVLLRSVDVSEGNEVGTMVIHGFVNKTQLPEDVADAVDLPGITFLE